MKGRRAIYKEVEIPTDAAMERMASELHTEGVPVLTEVLGWKVFYIPNGTISYTVTSRNSFSTDRSETTKETGTTIATCVFGYKSDEWQVAYVWGEDGHGPPRRLQERGHVVPIPELVQRSLFDAMEESVVETKETLRLLEGAIRRAETTEHERNPEARRLCILHHGTACSVCGLDLGSRYGKIAEGFIHVHHLNPLADAEGERQVDPVVDLRPVCPNCHGVMHLRVPPLSVEEIRALLQPT